MNKMKTHFIRKLPNLVTYLLIAQIVVLVGTFSVSVFVELKRYVVWSVIAALLGLAIALLVISRRSSYHQSVTIQLPKERFPCYAKP